MRTAAFARDAKPDKVDKLTDMRLRLTQNSTLRFGSDVKPYAFETDAKQ